MRKRFLAAALSAVFLLLVFPTLPVEAAFDGKAPDCSITYDFGNGQIYTIGNDMAKTMCVTNPDGSFYIDPATNKYVVDPWKVLSFLNALKTLYSAKGQTMDFLSTRGEVIQVRGGSQYAMDVASELQYLYAAIVEERKETRTVVYGIGSTYVEVDMGLQMLYYYQNGVKVLETPIVTGNTGAGMGTPTGVFYVNNKQRSTYLVGRNYRSYVAYWMPIIGNSIGIHDANWRGSFGGNIYTYNGSHGCINVPPAVMPAVFEAVQIGTPAVLFY